MKANSFTKILSAATVVALLSTSSSVFAQVKIGSNPATIGSSSNLEVEATNGKKVIVDKTTGATTVQSLTTASATDSIVTANQGTLDQMSISRLAQILKTTYGLGSSTTGTTQSIRIGLNNQGLGANAFNAYRFNQANSAAEMGTGAFGGQNYINTIAGSSFEENVALPAGSGTSARTTDRIILPAGIYKITGTVVGIFNGNASANYLDFEVNVDNTAYSVGVITNYDLIEGTGGVATTMLELTSSKAVDFSGFSQASSFTVSNPASGAASPKTYYSQVLIEKLQ